TDWLPDYWFLGLFQQLNGTATAETARLAHRAWIGLGIVALITIGAYAVSYVRTLRKLVEEPGIIPGTRHLHWSPRFGSSVCTAIVQFSIRAFARSRHHRIILAFYVGIGFALMILLARWRPANAHSHAQPMPANLLPIVSDIMILFFWV